MQGLTSVPSDEASRLLDALVAPFAHGEGAVAGLVERLRRNKYPLLALDAAAKDHPLLSQSETWRAELAVDRAELEAQRREYLIVKRAWLDAGIPCVMFKSAGEYPSFPYTSDNLDILVPRNRLDEARRILVGLGYVWLRNIDETQKFLFRKFRAGSSVSAIHVHTWVGWDVEFHEEAIWDGVRQSGDDADVMVPSAEDAVLVNVSHALYENKEIRLYDLEKVRSQWRGGLHWEYVEGVARRRGWLDGLYFGLLVCAKLERAIYGYNTVPANVRRRWHVGLKRYPLQWRYWRKVRKQEFDLPFRVSFAMSKALYYKKILRDSHDAIGQRLLNLVHTLAWGVKQKSGIRPQRGMLISISGTDGAGKTAQARALSQALTTSEAYNDVVWSRIGTTPLYRWASQTAQRTTSASRKSVSASTGAPGALRRALGFAWATANALDLALTYQWRVRLPLMMGRVVVCDRYTHDAAVEIAERLGPAPRRDVARQLQGLDPGDHVIVSPLRIYSEGMLLRTLPAEPL
ncbi:MAG: nucleotidyltransferase family protein [Chloroflexi bacterium]|nr:nucleotidyltransferase family protein [Chloroflexota bacterium]